MHDLKPLTALGGTAAQVDTIGSITITEQPGIALTSVTARAGQATHTSAALGALIAGDPPGPGHAAIGGDYAIFWSGPDQWMVAASDDMHPLLACDLATLMQGHASVTEQSGAWAQFDVSGEARVDMLERLTALDVRRMQALDANRTRIEQLNCFVLCFGDTFGIIGPRSSAKSLHHGLITAAQSVT